ncbi:unnamed protein product [Schistosoma turkestanicum]|nr:unnamed protein product [Schistosoma turkestanicum]
MIMSLKSKKEQSSHLKYPPSPPPPAAAAPSSSSSLNKQNQKKMIKHSVVTFEQSTTHSSNTPTTCSNGIPPTLSFCSTSSSHVSPEYCCRCNTNQCHQQTRCYKFSYLLRVNPPIIPNEILNYLGFITNCISNSTTLSMSTTAPTPTIIRPLLSNVNVNSTGKIKVIVCINQQVKISHNNNNNLHHHHANQGQLVTSNSTSNCIQIDENRKFIRLINPTGLHRRKTVINNTSNGSIVKNYKFDHIITKDTMKREFYSIALNDALNAVLNGKDSCILTIGHKATAAPSSSSISNKQNKNKMIKRSVVTFEQNTTHSSNTPTTCSNGISTTLSFCSTSSSLPECCCNTNQCNQQTRYYKFSYLLRVNPPIIPNEILNYLGFITNCISNSTTLPTSTPAPTIRPLLSNVNVNSTGKIKVIVCINQQVKISHNNNNNNLHHHHANQGQLVTSNPASNCIQIDENRKFIRLINPTGLHRRKSVINNSSNVGISSIVKNYKFDHIITKDTMKREFYSIALNDALKAVLNGKDSCILTIGHKATGKTQSMIGYDDYSSNEYGIIPYGISWLYQLLNYQKRQYNTRFSIRISAVEITGLNEEFHDLLANTKVSYDEEYCDKSPSHYLQTTSQKSTQRKNLNTSMYMNKTNNLNGNFDKTQIISTQMISNLSNLCELRASTAEKAAYLLDIALSNRTVHQCNNLSGLSHMLFTIHLYQCKLENNSSEMSISGGRTKFHFLDLGCGRYGQHHLIHTNASIELTQNNHSSSTDHSMFNKQETTSSTTTTTNHSMSNHTTTTHHEQDEKPTEHRTLSKALSLSGIGSVLLALLTGRRQLPYSNSALTYLLREAIISGNQIQPCILAHISDNVQYYTETLQILQLASEINRLKRRKITANHNPPPPPPPLHHHHQTPGEMDDSSNSSTINTTDTEDYQSKLSSSCHYTKKQLLYRQPKLGRLSYQHKAKLFGSCNSELDYHTSSGEQSCDTVIYLGHNKSIQSQYRLNDDSRMLNKLNSMEKLESRGLADGRVDSIDKLYDCKGEESFKSFADLNNNNHIDAFKQKNSMDQHPNTLHLNNLPTVNNSITTIKRMIPRTNATVWPNLKHRLKCRKFLQSSLELSSASASSSSETTTTLTTPTTLTTTEETWIDGPNVCLSSTSSALQTATPPSQQPPAPPPPPPSYHNCVHNLIKEHHVQTSFLSNSEEICEQLQEESIINSTELQNIHPISSMNQSIDPFNTQNSSNNNNNNNNISRALSDISECTEDADTIHDTNSLKKSLINLSIHDKLSTTASTTTTKTTDHMLPLSLLLLSSSPSVNLFSFDHLSPRNSYQSTILNIGEKSKNSNHPVSSISTMVNTPTTPSNNTKPTEVLLDIGRQIREASKRIHYTVPTSYVKTVNVPQYLTHVNEDDELMSNLNNVKSPLLNQELFNQLKQPVSMNEAVITSNPEGDNSRISLSSSMKFTQNNKLNNEQFNSTIPFNVSINSQEKKSSSSSNQQVDCSPDHINCQHFLTQSQLNTSIVDRKLTYNSLHNNNTSHTVTTTTTTTTTTSTTNSSSITNNITNNSFIRVAEWVSSISSSISSTSSSTTPCSNQSNHCENCSICHSNNNDNNPCLNYTSPNMVIKKRKSHLIKSKNHANNSIHHHHHSTTPSTTLNNNSTIGSSLFKCTKPNYSMFNSGYVSKSNEVDENKQIIPLYYSHNDSNIQQSFYSSHAMKSNDICQIPQSYSTPIFPLSSSSPSSHEIPTPTPPLPQPPQNLHSPYNYRSNSLTPGSFIETNHINSQFNVHTMKDQKFKQNQMINSNLFSNHPNYHHHCYPQTYTNLNNHDHSQMINNSHIFPSTHSYSREFYQNSFNNIDQQQSQQGYTSIPCHSHYIQDQIIPPPTTTTTDNTTTVTTNSEEKSKMKLSFKFFTLPLLRSFRLRKKMKKENSDKIHQHDTSNQVFIVKNDPNTIHTTNNNHSSSMFKNNELIPTSPSIESPIKLTSFSHSNYSHPSFTSDNNSNNNYLLPTTFNQQLTTIENSHSMFSDQYLQNSHHPDPHPHHHGHQPSSNQYLSHENQYNHYQNQLCCVNNNNNSNNNEFSSIGASFELNTINGKSTCRSSRRSGGGVGGGGICPLGSAGGGPSSSGYESMHTGASELSLLSHPDSTSDCSGHMKETFISKRSSLDEYRRRCHSQQQHHQHRQHRQHRHHHQQHNSKDSYQSKYHQEHVNTSNRLISSNDLQNG